MEIPTDVIHRLQTSLREVAFAPTVDAWPAPPFPTVADAVSAFDSTAAASVSAELRCGRCGAAGGLLRGAQSALCAYCGSPRRVKEGEGCGIAFRDGPAYRWLLGSLGLDGSELVEFDSETTGLSKSKEASTSGMIISDLLDLKLTCLPEKETSASSITKERSCSVDTLNLSAANPDSFFIERKEERTAASASPPQTGVQEKKRTASKSHGSSRSEVYVASKDVMIFQKTNQIEASPAFASWDTDFQSGDSKQPDLFKGSSVAESISFPASETAINPLVGTENKTNMKSTVLEHTEDLSRASGTLFDDKLFNQKVAQHILESKSGTVPEESVPELTGSSVLTNFGKSDPLPGSDDTGANDDDDAFDDWQEFSGSGDQGSLPNAGEHIVEPLKGDSAGIKTIDPWPVGSSEPPNNVNEDSSDDWQAFASVSGQGGDLVKSEEGTRSGHGRDLVRPVVETTSGISPEHSSEVTIDLWPVSNVKAHNAKETAKETDDSFDDWQDFTTSGQLQGTSLNQGGERMEVAKVSHKETDMDPWFMGNIREPANTGTINENNMLGDWERLTGSDPAQQNSSKTGGEITSVLFEQDKGTISVQSWVSGSNNGATETSSTNIESDAFDIWQDFTKPGHPLENISNLGTESTSIQPEPSKQIDSLDLWLTSNFNESKSREGVRRIDASSNGWQDFASFDQYQRSTKIPGEGHLVKDPSGTETLDLWASNHTNEKNLEQISEKNDLFDDWQDFQNSRPQQTTFQVSSDASFFDIPSDSRPDALVGQEFASFSQLGSENKKNEKESSNEAKAVPSAEYLKSTNEMEQMGNVDSLSAIWPPNNLDNNAISKSEPVDTNVEHLLSQMHDLSFMLKDELSVPDKPIDHSKS